MIGPDELRRCSRLHRKSMMLAEQASLEHMRGRHNRGRKLMRDAYNAEREAASVVAPHLHMDPTRSVLHHSAAWLALNCGEAAEAEHLVSEALDGFPPSDIAEELCEIKILASAEKEDA